MSKVIVFGVRDMRIRYFLSRHCETVLAVVYNNSENFEGDIFGHRIISPDKILDYDFDKIVIAINTYALTKQQQHNSYYAVKEIINQLSLMGIEKEKIELTSVNYCAPLSQRFGEANPLHYQRVEFLKYFAEHNNIEGAVAECGVFTGEFAAHINRYYPDRKCYLFDTFTGYCDVDSTSEMFQESKTLSDKELTELTTRYIYTDEDLVLLKCPNKENIIIRKGRIPETLEGLENEKFAFVSLDMNLYKPTLSALIWFVPRMSKGGIIICHDYTSKHWGIDKVVHEIAEKFEVSLFPIGDNLSIAVMPK